MNEIQQEYFSPREAAKYLHVAERTLFGWRKKGLPYYRQGRVVRFKRDEIDAWMRTHRIEETRESNASS